MGTKTFNFVVEKATEIPRTGWTNKNRVHFTLWNPNGAMAIHRAAYQRLLDAVSAGKVKGGALIAYDNDYHWKALTALLKKSRISDFEATYHASALIELTDKINTFLVKHGVEEKNNAAND